MTVVNAFGQSLILNSTASDFVRDDSLWRIRNVYEPALTAQTLAQEGVAIDIGAGFGVFGLMFAAAFPGWQVYCLEPDPLCLEALRENAEAQGLTNLTVLPFALGRSDQDAAEDPAAVRQALADLRAGQAEAVERLAGLLPRRDFCRHRQHLGYMQPGPAPSGEFVTESHPTLAARYLEELSPNLIKLVAPQSEVGILTDLQEVPIDHILGEAWGFVPSALVYGDCPGQRLTHLPLAGPPLLNLRRGVDLSGRVARLDVVVAMYNSRPFILDCVAGILNGDSREVHVIVVDDGSSDGGAELVEAHWGHDPRVRVLRKPNGGCASARNFGRLHSDASHIAFVDADDVPGRNLFSGLLELARHTGAETVQGGFEMLFDDGQGGLRVEASYEGEEDIIRQAQRHHFGWTSCHLLPSAYLMQGQPTIWRRVYRRDFLDNRKIWFPEHIRAFDDQIFQILTLQAVANVPVLDGVAYGYRQHPGQDIRQGDERNFYSLEMFRLVLKRGLTEGWPRFDEVLASFVNTVNWISAKLRPDLVAPFVKGAAELWVYAQKCLGDEIFAPFPPERFHAEGFAEALAATQERLKNLRRSYVWAYLDSFEMQVPLMKSLRVAV